MKRILACLLLMIYAASSMGMRVHVHYCMDKWSGIEFFGKREKCPGCGMDTRQEKKDCCRDVVKILKSGKSHITTAGLMIMDAPCCFLQQPLYSIESAHPLLKTPQITSNSGAPPGNPVYLLCRSIRI